MEEIIKKDDSCESNSSIDGMDLSVKRDTVSAEPLSQKTTPLTIVVPEPGETNRRKQKHPQSVRTSYNASPEPNHPAPERRHVGLPAKRPRINGADFSYINGDYSPYGATDGLHTESETIRQQFDQFKRLSSQRWESLRKENNLLRQELNLLKSVLTSYLKKQSEKDAVEAVDALQNTYFVTEDSMQSAERVILLGDNKNNNTTLFNGNSTPGKQDNEKGSSEENDKIDPEVSKHKLQCDLLQKQIRKLQHHSDRLRGRTLPALSHDTKEFLRWVLVTADDGDDAYPETPNVPYFQTVPHGDSNSTWQSQAGGNESWRATPTDSWKDPSPDRTVPGIQQPPEDHLTPVSTHGTMEEIELWPETGVYVNSGDIASYVENSHKNPAVLFHSLVKHFFNLDQLSRSVPYGPHNNKKCDKEVLPENIVKAIEGYVLCCASQPNWKPWTQHQLRKAFSNKCTGARRNHIKMESGFQDESDVSLSILDMSAS